MKIQRIKSRLEFLAHALAIETEAAERYATFADQMEVTNNPEVAGLFRKMAGHESEHARQIEMLAEGQELPHIAPWDYAWGSDNPPEGVDMSDTHYLMTPWQALTLILEAEQRAVTFFQNIVDSDVDEDTLSLAHEFLEEEQEHVDLIKVWRDRYPVPESGWDDDPDPPNQSE